MAELVSDELWRRIEPLLPLEPKPSSQRRAAARDQSAGFYGRRIRVEDRYRLANAAHRNGLWQRQHVLAPLLGVDAIGGLVATPCVAADGPGQSGSDQSRTGCQRQRQRASLFWGAPTGPNPTDRAKAGSKRHVLTDANGVPLVVKTTPAKGVESCPRSNSET
jgi:hypothetical protein